jgi:hypothetical protein
VTFVIDALAAYRLTRLVVEDEITSDLRDLVWRKFDPGTTKVGYLLTCPHCTSVWVAGAIVLARHIAPKAARPATYALALAGAASLVNDARAWADVVG